MNLANGFPGARNSHPGKEVWSLHPPHPLFQGIRDIGCSFLLWNHLHPQKRLLLCHGDLTSILRKETPAVPWRSHLHTQERNPRYCHEDLGYSLQSPCQAVSGASSQPSLESSQCFHLSICGINGSHSRLLTPPEIYIFVPLELTSDTSQSSEP